MNIINYIEANGFKVKGRYILKRSSSTRGLKTVGVLNEKSFYLFSDNVHPFKSGINYYNESTLVNPTELKQLQHYIKAEKEKEVNAFNIDFEKYQFATRTDSTFLDFLSSKISERLNTPINNYYDVRGVRNGYLENSAVFPIFDYNNKFITAQIIKYGVDGKRVKSQFSTTWFHSYKPIKEDVELDADTKYSISIKSFFGENYLKGSNNIVGIVEAPKTAVILKEFYPNIDWIATFGETQLNSKNLDVLKGKEVILFPDAHTTLWKEIASKKGFYVCDVLEKNNVEAGSDLADYIFSNCDISKAVHNYLNGLTYSKKDLQFSDLDLDFRQVGTSAEYFPILPLQYVSRNVTKHLIHKTDNSNEFKKVYEGFHFDIYNKKYWVLNANVDFHKLQRKDSEKGYHFFNEQQFIYHLQKCFRGLVYLNKHLTTAEATEVFKIGLNRLLDNSNFRFNINYVLNVLIPLWTNTERDITDFYKFRDWKFKGTEVLTRKEFEQFLNNDKFRYKFNLRLLGFKDAVEEDRFIDIETDLGLKPYDKQRGYSQIFDLVNNWNENVIGAKTLKSYFNQLEISEKLKEITDCTKSLHLHSKSIYRGAKKMYSTKTLTDWCKLLGVKNRSTLKSFFTFKPCYDTRTLIGKRIDELVKNIKEINPVRFKVNGVSKITDFVHKEQLSEAEHIKQHLQDWKDVFKTTERLAIELEHIKEDAVKNAYLFEIKYLIHIKDLQIKEAERIQPTLSDFKIDDILNKTDKNIDVSHIKVVDF